ncbi:hypothetical protein AMAG_01229 [Allomyces macrogynus ATCC 38327]|uniref:Nucleolar protein 12 n=1 Tax=Allomyces macrogynus (strain ATCC 38327) TaxID=578462 RepID=A0A0L0RY47_ALLM3|nr:hypothetical protein AMAG_01229 [Allomyces macrogynus ATCC 38327]|eukprot:KNE55327.1 hypothetical protein AMAG_01229 [Allomyces macrogynus ATCC 38327]
MSGFDALFKRDPTKFDAELDSLFAVSKTAAKPAPAAAPVPSKKQAAAPAKQPVKKQVATPRSTITTAAASSDEASNDDEGSDDDEGTQSGDDEDVAMAAASDDDAESATGDSDDEEESGEEEGDDEEAVDGSEDGEEDEDASESADEASSDTDDATPANAASAAGQDKKPKSMKQLEKEKLARTVFVGNVTIKASEKAIDQKFKQLFAEYGKVESVRYRSIAFSDALPRKLNFKLKNFHPSRDTMHAYVVFTDAASARKAAGAVNGTVFENKHLRTDYCGPDAPAKGGADDDEAVAKRTRDPKRCVFVGNVPFDVEDEELWEFFGQVAEVDSVRVIRDRKLGIGKGFAYVQFKERSSVPLALKLHETKFRNKPLRIFKCMKETGPGAAGPQQQQQSQQKGRGGKGGRPGAGPTKPGVAGKPSKKRTRDSNDDGEPAKKRARKPKTSKQAASWKKGHEAKKRKTAAELPRKLAKKVKKLNAQSGKK